MKKETLLTFYDKEGIPFVRDALKVVSAEAMGKRCMLYFESGERLVWNKTLGTFHKMKVWASNQYRRLDRTVLIKITGVKRLPGKAILFTGKIIYLGREANSRLKKYLEKHPQ